MNAAVFFDRDGVLNEVVMRGEVAGSPRIVEEFRLLDGAPEMVRTARSAGFRIVLATNQPDVERGLMKQEALDWMLDQISALGFDGIEVSYSGTHADRRAKPNPGMLLDAAERLEIDLSRSFFVGDSWRDLDAGKAAGVRTVLLETEYNTKVHGTADFGFRTIAEISHFLGTRARELAFG